MRSPVIIPAPEVLSEVDLLKWNELLAPVMLPVTVRALRSTPAPWNLKPIHFQGGNK